MNSTTFKKNLYFIINSNPLNYLTLYQIVGSMKSLLNIVKWTAIVAGVIAIPIIIKKQLEATERESLNIRYDINDYISETGL